MAKTIKKRIAFSLQAPDASSVRVAGDFSEWEKNPVILKRLKNGLWKTTVSLAPGTYQYRFLVDSLWYDDPACPTRVPNPYGEMNCVLKVE